MQRGSSRSSLGRADEQEVDKRKRRMIPGTLTLAITTTTTTIVLNASPAGHNDETFAEINNSLMEEVGFDLRYVSLDVASYFEPFSASSTSKTISIGEV
jgi:hypothetical protein